MYIQKGDFFITHGYALPYYEHKIVEQFGEAGRQEIAKMLDKKQLFIQQAKKFLKDNL